MGQRALMQIILLSCVWSPGILAAGAEQADQRGDDTAPPAASSSGQAGYMLSDGMLKALLKRSAYELARTMEMDDEQRQSLAQKVDELWMPFFQEHRNQMGPLVERMIQAQWDPDLPSAEEAQSWARQALKMQELLAKHVQTSNQEVAKLLTPQQLEKFKDLAAKFDAGLSWFKVELRKMEQGSLDDTMWAKRRLARLERQQRYQRNREQRKWEQVLSSPELAALTVDAWDAYVARFVEQFRLDDAQKLVATSVLDDVKNRARQYVRSHANDLQEVTREVKTAAEDQRQQIMEQRGELVKPLNDLFAELQTRLEQIPTEAQRSQAKPGERPEATNDG